MSIKEEISQSFEEYLQGALGFNESVPKDLMFILSTFYIVNQGGSISRDLIIGLQ